MGLQVQFFIDFDGTISLQDVGTAFFLEFGTNIDDFLGIENAWLAGEISSSELYQKACKLIEVTPDRFAHFLAEQDIDISFVDFAREMQQAGDDIHILSDGFENYIAPILDRYELGHLDIIANAFRFLPEQGGIDPHFPYLARSCGKCANCKGYHVRRLRKAGAATVFIGNGLSDQCGARECEYVIAKGELADFCRVEQLEYFPFENFHDIYKHIEQIRDHHRRAG